MDKKETARRFMFTWMREKPKYWKKKKTKKLEMCADKNQTQVKFSDFFSAFYEL